MRYTNRRLLYFTLLLILRKIVRMVATICQILRLKGTKIQFRLRIHFRPRWGSLQRSPRSITGFKEVYFYGEGKGRKGRIWKGSGKEGRRTQVRGGSVVESLK